ncbi:MAG TPA: MlaE family lipid ABC transporter permease subunit [Caldithrix abyssi]|uniref:MlaE family lipid ABC transporter permease subunit n=1 Tax=Caldithrix abyssi TaxID=187145 RepID=A0A7V4U184_CALAY|nr:MlaE family lipid ABC transporter permease subunit [Caldithrix abyssi]
MEPYSFELPETLDFHSAESVYRPLQMLISGEKPPSAIVLDFKRVKSLDSAGAAVVDRLQKIAEQKNITLIRQNLAESISQTLQLFQLQEQQSTKKEEKPLFLEKVGDTGFSLLHSLGNLVLLLSNMMYWSFIAFFKPGLRRKDEVIHQSLNIGANALGIVGLISFLIGFVLALQSAAQLQLYGANIYVADLVALAMISEMGPLITAIMVAGRSGSAIAAEIATMQVSEEIDALKVMGIDPLPYLVVPKVYAITMTLPLLTMFANALGIMGGMLIGYTYLDIEILPFYNEVLSVLRYKEVFISLLKSFVFAWIIIVTGTYFGFKVKGGAEGVGRVTTASVVFSIFWVIVADSIIGLLFYFR